MNTAIFLIDPHLQFFLPDEKQSDGPLFHSFDGKVSVKDMIESLGVPHTEIYTLRVNRKAVDFSYIVQADDIVQVGGDYTGEHSALLRPPLQGVPRFILDQHLGRLAAYLRMMGFDTLYRNNYHDEELAQVSADEGRVLLTRDIGLLKRGMVVYGYFVRSTQREEQLVEILRRYDLLVVQSPFKHCMKCNGLLHPISREAAIQVIPRMANENRDDYHQCDSCQQIYWKGSHYDEMQALIERVIVQVEEEDFGDDDE